jgi:hypothetical protein
VRATAAVRAMAAATATAATARPMTTMTASMRTLNAGAEPSSSGPVSCVLPPSGLAHHLVRWPRRRVHGASPSAGPIGRQVSSPERACEWIIAMRRGGRWGWVDCPWKMSLDGSAPNGASLIRHFRAALIRHLLPSDRGLRSRVGPSAKALDWLSSGANNVKGGRRTTARRELDAPAGGGNHYAMHEHAIHECQAKCIPYFPNWEERLDVLDVVTSQ